MFRSQMASLNIYIIFNVFFVFLVKIRITSEQTNTLDEGISNQSSNYLLKFMIFNTSKYNTDLQIFHKPMGFVTSKVYIENKATKYIYYVKYDKRYGFARNIVLVKSFGKFSYGKYNMYVVPHRFQNSTLVMSDQPTSATVYQHDQHDQHNSSSPILINDNNNNNVDNNINEMINNTVHPTLMFDKKTVYCFYNYYFYYFDRVGHTNYMKKFSEHNLRLNTIKFNILSKLGFVIKPNVTGKVPRQVIINTLKRADIKESHFFASHKYTWNYRSLPTNIYKLNVNRKKVGADDKFEEDFGKPKPNIQEVIIFAAKERVSYKQTIIEFNTSFRKVIRDKMGGSLQNRSKRLRSAFLWLKVSLKRRAPKPPDSNRDAEVKTTLWIFRLLYSKAHGKYRATLSAIKKISSHSVEWKSFDITSTFRLWNSIDLNTQNLRFLIECSGFCKFKKPKKTQFHKTGYDLEIDHPKSMKNIITSTLPSRIIDEINGNYSRTKIVYKSIVTSGSKSNEEVDVLLSLSIFPQSFSTKKNHGGQNPFLVIYIHSYNARRSRRRVDHCSKNQQDECCKEKLYVNFRELGWSDWIIAPHGYYANYCRGDCKGNQLLGLIQSNHGHVVGEYRKQEKHRDTILACCTPVQFSSMSIIYYEENRKIVKRELPKMVVDSCGCP